MVDAGGAIAQIFDSKVQIAGQFLGSALDRMAQAYLFDVGKARADRPGVDRHRIYILQQGRIGADRAHIFADRPQVGHSAQAAHNAANTQCIGYGLIQTIAFGQIKIGGGARFISANLERNNDEISPLKSRTL